ncbi:MAG: ATP-binding cassette domain-containing protein, partial [Acidimicrobiia bacterium]|nr:ATP-binding cassette domain-containing protein [Acidimicrobiia bacterium]
MSLVVDIELRLGTLDLDVKLEVEPGELVALLGPNGAGKSTVLRCIAGLLPTERGSIRIDDDLVDDPLVDVYVPAEHRSIGVMFQDYLLFANMSALENVAFGLRARGTDKQRARAVAGAWLSRVGMNSHAGHRPRALSGGQAQRVALARALAPDPRVLL